VFWTDNCSFWTLIGSEKPGTPEDGIVSSKQSDPVAPTKEAPTLSAYHGDVGPLGRKGD
jgi:hypothetical protein